MKIRYNIAHGFWVVIFLFLVWSCGKDDSSAPGPNVKPDNQGVVFDGRIPTVIEVEANQQGELIDDQFTVPVFRDDQGSLSELEVPAIVRHASETLFVDVLVVFDA